MKRFTQISLILTILIGFNTMSLAQGQNAETKDTILTIDISDFLPPLTLIIDSALKNSPEVGFFASMLEASEYDVSLEKKSWSNDLSFRAGYTWTFGNQLVLNGITTGGSDANEGYTYGASLSIPLSSWYTRSDRIKRAEAIRGSQQSRIDEAAIKVREAVIDTYEQVLLMQRLLKIASDAKEASRLQLEMAEQMFKDGELSLEELGAATDYKARYAAEYERTRTAFSIAYSRLERLAGVSFSKMKNE